MKSPDEGIGEHQAARPEERREIADETGAPGEHDDHEADHDAGERERQREHGDQRFAAEEPVALEEDACDARDRERRRGDQDREDYRRDQRREVLAVGDHREVGLQAEPPGAPDHREARERNQEERRADDQRRQHHHQEIAVFPAAHKKGGGARPRPANPIKRRR